MPKLEPNVEREPFQTTGADMNRTRMTNLLLALALGATMGSALAQGANPAATASASRVQVRMETQAFLKTHRWDESSDSWLLKSGVEPPTGVASRTAVKAQRDEFLRLNRWNESSGTWSARKPATPTISPQTRAQVRADTTAFMRTHRWDEEAEAWVAMRPATTR